MGINILHEAFYQLQHGYAVIPVDRHTKRPLVKWSPYMHQLPTEKEWQEWYLRWRDCNLGLVTGYWLNRVVLDFDTEREFDLWKDWQDQEHGILTMVIKTGRGYHVHFETHDQPGRSFIAKAGGGYSVEVKARGNFVVIPPSVHASGQVYRLIGPRTTPQVVKKIDDVLGPFKREAPTPRQYPLPIHPQPTNGKLSKVGAIKATFRIEQYVKNANSTPDGRGRVTAQCPLPDHTDKHKSFWFHPQEQVCACAKCTPQGTWDVINLYAAIHSISNNEAIEELYQLTPQGLREER